MPREEFELSATDQAKFKMQHSGITKILKCYHTVLTMHTQLFHGLHGAPLYRHTFGSMQCAIA